MHYNVIPALSSKSLPYLPHLCPVHASLALVLNPYTAFPIPTKILLIALCPTFLIPVLYLACPVIPLRTRPSLPCHPQLTLPSLPCHPQLTLPSLPFPSLSSPTHPPFPFPSPCLVWSAYNHQ
ncbi:hypothetical protein Pcinc_026269 [Petrolisthes cinctipes]|uniref:Uncharacterized protein n=1 Tax=Petrolisthes cinctipes TaxID=88211 RepID=A0AAE1KAK8_PETCI|nr:hypothetical protein Pcinc_026269 [Petrolisthes cinctipes]